MNSLEDKLKFARKSAGFSQNALAKKIGITSRTLQRYEKDASKLPIGIMKDIAHICSVDLIWLINGPDQENEKAKNSVVHLNAAVQILHEVLEETGAKFNEKQKQACLKILKEELEKSDSKVKEDLKKYVKAFDE